MTNVTMSLWSLTTAQLRDQVGSIAPTPGGGSVSIITAALAASSIQKGIVVSLKKSVVDSTRYRNLSYLNSRISTLIVTLSDFADADSIAFLKYLDAGTLPNTTEDEKATRKEARASSLVDATHIPLIAAAEMGRCLEFAGMALDLVDAHVRSEVLSGCMLLRASIKSVLFSVDANLSGITDETLQDSFRRKRNELERVADCH